MSTPSETKQALGLDSRLYTGGAETPITSTEENVDTSAQEAQEGTQGPRLFGSLTPQEAGRRSAQARRERVRSGENEAVDQHADEVKIVRTTVATGAIIKRLSKDAAQGNVQAARELRGWLAELPIETDTDLSALDRRTRQALLAKLLLMVSEEPPMLMQAAPMEAGQEQAIEADADAAVRPDATPPSDGTPVE